jgi:DNA-binding SARP family transcriptional activator/tetratricopeptide (TPR) repeat protein
MKFGVLGPLEVLDDDRKVALGGPRPRALLAILLLHRGEVVPVEQLIDQLYGGRPPRGAVKSIQAHVSRLRKALADGCELRALAGGYALELGSDNSLDLDRFDHLVERGRQALTHGDAEVASSSFADALALWRGPPLADFRYDDFAQAEIGRLEERKLAVIEDWIEAELALGRHADVVPELERLVNDHPLRERPRGQLMLALYRSGRQAEALEVYAETRRLLSEELGLEPGGELKDLQRAILEHDASLAARSRVERPRRRAASDFVGRSTEFEALRRALEDAVTGRGRLVLISGEPGIGKSRIAEELAEYAQRRTARVLVGRCWEAGGAPAYWPWVQSLRTYIRDCQPDVLRGQLGAGAPDLAQLLPELCELFPDLPAPPSLESEGARFRLFDAAATFLRNSSRAQPLVLILDDLQAADEPSLLLLQFLARELGESRVLVVAAYRDVDPTLRHPLAAALAQLTREPVTSRIALGGLTEANVGEYVSLTADVDPDASAVAEIHAQTEGNPLFVGELVRLLAREGRLDKSDGNLGIPAGVREVIGSRVQRLSERCQHVLTLASVLGREFRLDALELVSERSRETLLEILDEAAAERVVGEVPGAAGRLRFAHALIRDTLYDELPATRRVRLHARVGKALEALYSEDAEPHLAELAHHFYEATPAGTVGEAIAYARRAGDRAVSVLAFEEAVSLYEMALQLTADGDAARCDLLLALGEAHARAGDTPAAKATFREAAELAVSQGLPEHLARAALGYGGRLMWDVSRDDAHLVSLLERALTALGDDDSVLRVRLLARLAGGPLRDSTADAERRRSLGAQALEMARRIAEPSTLAYALHGYIASRHSPDFTHEQAEIARELVQVALQARDLERAVEGYEEHLDASIELGDLPAAYTDVEAMTTLAEELRQPAQRWLVAVHRALLALLEGRFEEAEQLIAETRSLGERSMGWNAAVTYGLQLYLLRREQGRLEEVEGLVRRAATDNPTYPIWRCVLANMLAELGSTDEACTQLEALAADGFSRLPFDEEWEISMCLLAETVARLGDRPRAATLYERLLPYADRVAISYPEISLGPVSRFLGILAAATGHWDDAERHFRDSLEFSGRIGARPSLAHTQTDYAQMLLEREEPSGSAKARILVDQALATYRELGMGSHFVRAVPLRERATPSVPLEVPTSESPR